MVLGYDEEVKPATVVLGNGIEVKPVMYSGTGLWYGGKTSTVVLDYGIEVKQATMVQDNGKDG